jgi:DNA-binding transcriptional LysR family regulator
MADLEWYRSFVAVYRAGTVSGAARTRFLTQPAVSQQLAALESALGQALFERTPRRMLPTAHGKELYASVAPAVDLLEQAPQALRAAAAARAPTLLRLGAPAEYFYERIAPRLAATPWRLRVEFAVAEALVDRLKRAELDAVVATQQLPVAGVEYRRVDTERFVLVGAPDLRPPRAGRAVTAAARAQAWFADQPWVSYSVEMPIIRRYWQEVFASRPEFQPRWVVPNLHAIRASVEAGAGISVLPEYLCAAALSGGRLRLLWKSPQPVSNDLWLAYRKAERNTVAMVALRAALQAATHG